MGSSIIRRAATLLLLGSAAMLPAPLAAQAINAPSGRTLFQHATLIRSFVQINRSSLSANGASVNVTQYVTPLALVYGFLPNWSLIAVQPYVTVDVTTRTNTARRRQDLNGFADSQLFVQYDGLYTRNSPGGLTRLSGVFGLQLPDGARRFSPRAAGYTGGAIFEKAVRLKYVLTSDFEYTFATKNTHGVGMGDHAAFDAVPAYFLIPREATPAGAAWLRRFRDHVFRNGAYFLVEFNGSWQAQMQEDGGPARNTGGTTLSISPGVQYFVTRRFLVELSAPIPAVNKLNGIQPKPEASVLFGFRYLF